MRVHWQQELLEDRKVRLERRILGGRLLDCDCGVDFRTRTGIDFENSILTGH